MDITGIAAVVAALLGGAGVGSITNYLLSRRKQNGEEGRTNFDIITKHQSREIERLSKENAALGARVAHLEAALGQTERPFPEWSKDGSNRYLWVNGAFVREFLEPQGKSATDILGKMDAEVWPPEVAKMLSDLHAKANRNSHFQAFQSGVSFGHVPGTYTVRKWPIYIDSVRQGWRGLALLELD